MLGLRATFFSPLADVNAQLEVLFKTMPLLILTALNLAIVMVTTLWKHQVKIFFNLHTFLYSNISKPSSRSSVQS
jgi:hypothetical protein